MFECSNITTPPPEKSPYTRARNVPPVLTSPSPVNWEGVARAKANGRSVETRAFRGFSLRVALIAPFPGRVHPAWSTCFQSWQLAWLADDSSAVCTVDHGEWGQVEQ